MLFVEAVLRQKENDEGRVFDALEVEVLHGGHKPGLRLGRREKDETPGLDVYGRGGEPKNFGELSEDLRSDAAGRIVVFAGVARAGEFEHVHEGLLKTKSVERICTTNARPTLKKRGWSALSDAFRAASLDGRSGIS